MFTTKNRRIYMKKRIIMLALFGAAVVYAFKKEKSKKPQQFEQNQPMEKVTTPSGLVYEILSFDSNKSSPAILKTGSTVTVHYTGWLNNAGEPGKKFDSSVDRGTPFSFKIGVGQVIKGWDEGVASMKVGETRRLYIPANLGYGARGAGSIIPPNADLIFDVELLSVS